MRIKTSLYFFIILAASHVSTVGEEARLTCHFGIDVTSTSPRLSVKVRRNDHNDIDYKRDTVLDCGWTGDDLNCITIKDGFHFDYNVSDKLVLEVPSATLDYSGKYVCQLVGSGLGVPEACVFTVENTTALPDVDIGSSCVIHPVLKGENATLQCQFTKDLNTTQTGFAVYRTSPDNNRINITLSEAADQFVGTYTCQVAKGSSADAHNCSFTLEAEPATADEDVITIVVPAVVAILVIAILVIAVVIIVIFLCRRRAAHFRITQVGAPRDTVLRFFNILVLLALATRTVGENEQRRSDDTAPLQNTVNNMAQDISFLKAELTAAKQRITDLEDKDDSVRTHVSGSAITRLDAGDVVALHHRSRDAGPIIVIVPHRNYVSCAQTQDATSGNMSADMVVIVSFKHQSAVESDFSCPVTICYINVEDEEVVTICDPVPLTYDKHVQTIHRLRHMFYHRLQGFRVIGAWHSLSHARFTESQYCENENLRKGKGHEQVPLQDNSPTVSSRKAVVTLPEGSADDPSSIEEDIPDRAEDNGTSIEPPSPKPSVGQEMGIKQPQASPQSERDLIEDSKENRKHPKPKKIKIKKFTETNLNNENSTQI
ncbi:hypothetical protein BaRGS_00018470 [Batillaria attramentaria]|uniref:Ig-like domain-containing protein n=1 Tax=Batillaria attramentaria TaxID=370345 RepID=A0ABD0KSV1_9CAEN